MYLLSQDQRRRQIPEGYRGEWKANVDAFQDLNERGQAASKRLKELFKRKDEIRTEYVKGTADPNLKNELIDTMKLIE